MQILGMKQPLRKIKYLNLIHFISLEL